MKRISIVVPAYNEEASLPELYRRLDEVMAAEATYTVEFVFVDDGSTDATPLVLQKLAASDARVRYVCLSRNFGHQAALMAGLDHSTGDAVVMMDADLQHPPNLLPELLRRWEVGAEVVQTVRVETTRDTKFKRWTSASFYRLMNWLADTHITPGAADFRLLDRQAVDALRELPECARFFRGLVAWIGYTQATVPYRAPVRFSGSSKYSRRKMLRFAMDGLLSFSTVPLQLATWLGVAVSSATVLYAAYALYAKFVTGRVIPGWTSTLLVMLSLGGVQLVTLGLLGAYVARTYEEVKRRPAYFVRKKGGFTTNER